MGTYTVCNFDSLSGKYINILYKSMVFWFEKKNDIFLSEKNDLGNEMMNKWKITVLHRRLNWKSLCSKEDRKNMLLEMKSEVNWKWQ